jgi:uncharacterized phiE125 gp8 family phage protein
MFQTVYSRRITEPANEPLYVDDVIGELGLDGTQDHQAHVERLIKEARTYIENRYQLAVMRQQWRLYLDEFPCYGAIPLMRPAQSIAQVQYIDTDGATQTLASSVYELVRERSELYLAFDQSWPEARAQRNAVWVDVWSGFFDPDTSPLLDAVPEDIRGAMLAYIDTRFAVRGTAVVGTIFTPTPAFENLMQAYWKP